MLSPEKLYIGDNGRIFCGAIRCAGMTAHFSGQDLSGQKVEELGDRDREKFACLTGRFAQCERCGHAD